MRRRVVVLLSAVATVVAGAMPIGAPARAQENGTEDAALLGRVIGPGGRDVDGATASAYIVDENGHTTPHSSAPTNEAGSYSIIVDSGLTLIVRIEPPAGSGLLGEYVDDVSEPIDAQQFVLDHHEFRPIATSFLVLAPEAAPGMPTDVTARPGDRAVALRWTAPVAAAVDDYRILRATSLAGPWKRLGDELSATPSYTATGLTNGVPYYFRIAAINTGGRGPYSPAVRAKPRAVPGAPPSVVATAARRALSLSWRRTASNGARITDYVVQYSTHRGRGFVTFPDGTSTARAATITPLITGTRYFARVAAKNAAGRGAWSVVVSAIPA